VNKRNKNCCSIKRCWAEHCIRRFMSTSVQRPNTARISCCNGGLLIPPHTAVILRGVLLIFVTIKGQNKKLQFTSE